MSRGSRIPILSLPASCRARALFPVLEERLSSKELQNASCYSAESAAILNALEAGMQIEELPSVTFRPPIVPERGAPQAVVDAAIARLSTPQKPAPPPAKPPWWQFWKH